MCDKKNLRQNELQIINLSLYKLSVEEEKLLRLGLSFCPYQKVDRFEVIIDVYLFARKLILHIIHGKYYKSTGPSNEDTDLWKDFTINDFQALCNRSSGKRVMLRIWEHSWRKMLSILIMLNLICLIGKKNTNFSITSVKYPYLGICTEGNMWHQ